MAKGKITVDAMGLDRARALAADLALALRLLDYYAPSRPCSEWDERGQCVTHWPIQQSHAAHQCPVVDAQELLTRYGIRPEAV